MERLKRFWHSFMGFMGWALHDGIDGVGLSAGVLFRAYDFLAGGIYMSVYGWQVAEDGMKPVASILGFMLSWGMFYITHKLVKGIINKETWTANKGFLFWFVVLVLGAVAVIGDSLFIDSGWVFLAFGIPEFNNPLSAGSLGLAFGKLNVMGWVFYITSAIMSGLSEFADTLFRKDPSRVSYVKPIPENEPTNMPSGWKLLPPEMKARYIRPLAGRPGCALVRGSDRELYIAREGDPRVSR